MPDRSSVAEIAGLPWEQARESLQETVGVATSLAPLVLQLSETGLAVVAASGGTGVAQSRSSVNLEDARIDQIRLIGYGNSSGAGDSLRLRDVTGTPATLSTVTLPQPSAAYFAGTWTDVGNLIGGGSRQLLLEIMGNGSRTQTLFRVEVQMRTLRIVRR